MYYQLIELQNILTEKARSQITRFLILLFIIHKTFNRLLYLRIHHTSTYDKILSVNNNTNTF